MSTGAFEPAKTVSTINYTKNYTINKDRQKRGRAQSACDFKPFDTIGDQYWVPVRDHKYRINATYIIGDKRASSDTFMTGVINRAKSSVAPNKYSKVVDWRKQSHGQLRGVMPKARKMTSTQEIFEFQKKYKRPGPQNYKQWIKPKTKGFYNNSEPKYSVITSTAFVKKTIPAPNVYKGRGKDFFDKVKQDGSTVQYGPKGEAVVQNIRLTKIKKDDKPGPVSFEVAKCLEACKLRQPINQKIGQAKNINFVENILKQKKKIPGVGTYKTEKAFDHISTMPTSLKRKR